MPLNFSQFVGKLLLFPCRHTSTSNLDSTVHLDR